AQPTLMNENDFKTAEAEEEVVEETVVAGEAITDTVETPEPEATEVTSSDSTDLSVNENGDIEENKPDEV
ncbi:MAG: hypothetical protein ACTHLB_16740, partial [Parafilimonas sp.]